MKFTKRKRPTGGGEIKTFGSGRSQLVLVIPFGTRSKNTCVATTLQSYLKRPEEMPKDIEELFKSVKPPIRAVTTQTLCRWVKDTLKKCGIDTDIFSAHSTRHASTSAAKRLENSKLGEAQKDSNSLEKTIIYLNNSSEGQETQQNHNILEKSALIYFNLLEPKKLKRAIMYTRSSLLANFNTWSMNNS
uniref:Tyr recombinase domain-containing protein n=1 Tax=Trichogramma kaykai TaxID=54128 RepID=A0ABD2VZE0_9HYME